jgi:hypothetical protein
MLGRSVRLGHSLFASRSMPNKEGAYKLLANRLGGQSKPGEILFEGADLHGKDAI